MHYSAIQLDALGELANVGSGNAATALSQLAGRPVDLSLPNARVLPLREAVEAAGDSEECVTAVALPLSGDIEMLLLLLVTEEAGDTFARLLGVEPRTELASSAIAEVANIVGTSYGNALAQITGVALEPSPPQSATDMLGAIVSTVLASVVQGDEMTLLLETALAVEGEPCDFSLLMVPANDGIVRLLASLGLA